MLKELHHLLQELRSDDEKIAELAQKNEQDEGLGFKKVLCSFEILKPRIAKVLKRLQWMLASNPRIEPIVSDVIRIKKERKLVLTDFLTLKRKVVSFVEGVILLETMRLAGKSLLWEKAEQFLGHETDKLDVDIRKFLEQAEKVKV